MEKNMASKVPSSTLHLEGGVGILDIDTHLKYLKIKWIRKLLNPTNSLWKDHMLYQLKF